MKPRLVNPTNDTYNLDKSLVARIVIPWISQINNIWAEVGVFTAYYLYIIIEFGNVNIFTV